MITYNIGYPGIDGSKIVLERVQMAAIHLGLQNAFYFA